MSVPSDFNYTNHLKYRVRIGDINFDSLVRVLSEKGYITEDDYPQDASLISSHMERLPQAEFDELFAFFYPGRPNTIRLSCVATNLGGSQPTGAYAYALFNSAVIDRETVLGVLERENYVGEFSLHDHARLKDEIIALGLGSQAIVTDKAVQKALDDKLALLRQVEQRLKALGILELSPREQAFKTLDGLFPHAKSKDIVEWEGARYQRIFRPAQRSADGRVSRWDKTWGVLDDQVDGP